MYDFAQASSSSISQGLIPTATVPLPDRLRPKSHAKRQPEGHIPRPRNAFILFRCDFVSQKKVPVTVESDHRNISRIAGRVWGNMATEEKRPWVDMAALEKSQHDERYPGYRYTPSSLAAGTRPGKAKPAKAKREKDPAASASKRRARAATKVKCESASPPPMAMLRSPIPLLQAPNPQLWQPSRRRSSSCPPHGAVPLSMGATGPVDASFRPWDGDESMMGGYEQPVYLWQESILWTEAPDWALNESWTPLHAGSDLTNATSCSSELSSALDSPRGRSTEAPGFRWQAEQENTNRAHRPSLHRFALTQHEQRYEPTVSHLRRQSRMSLAEVVPSYQIPREAQDDLARRPSRTTFWHIPQPDWNQHKDLEPRNMGPPMASLTHPGFAAPWNIREPPFQRVVKREEELAMASLERPVSSLARDTHLAEAQAIVPAERTPMVPSHRWSPPPRPKSQPTGWQPQAPVYQPQQQQQQPSFNQHGECYPQANPHLSFTDPFAQTDSAEQIHPSPYQDHQPNPSPYQNLPLSPFDSIHFEDQPPYIPQPLADYGSPYSVDSTAVSTLYISSATTPYNNTMDPMYTPETYGSQYSTTHGHQIYKFTGPDVNDGYEDLGGMIPRLSMQ